MRDNYNRNWTNLLNFLKKFLLKSWMVFDLLKNNINIKTYAEYNGPFMGLFLDFFHDENKKM